MSNSPVRRSEDQDAFGPAFLEAQRKFGSLTTNARAEIPTKTGGAFRYSYADLSAVHAVVGPALHDAGIYWQQHPGVGRASNETIVTTLLVHADSSQWVESDITVPIGSPGGAQQHGSAITYARRYALVAICGLDIEDDDGAAAQPQPVVRTKGPSGEPKSSTNRRAESQSKPTEVPAQPNPAVVPGAAAEAADLWAVFRKDPARYTADLAASGLTKGVSLKELTENMTMRKLLAALAAGNRITPAATGGRADEDATACHPDTPVHAGEPHQDVPDQYVPPQYDQNEEPF